MHGHLEEESVHVDISSKRLSVKRSSIIRIRVIAIEICRVERNVRCA